MKRLPLLPAICLLFLVSCQERTGILNTNNLTSHFINIDAGKENTLRTPKGAVIKIAANSFDVPAGAKVMIEIKEAYSMNDILKAGLTTISNGKPLQSGGMIYFNATVDNKPVGYLKPVGIIIPTEQYNSDMKVFKGEISADSSINWLLDDKNKITPYSTAIEKGSALFKANCASCHAPTKEMTGPALAGCRDRAPTRDWAYKFTNNTNIMLEKDSYAKELFKKYGSRMTQFNLHKEEIKAILDYCDYEGGLYKPQLLDEKPDTTSSENLVDCGYDTLPVYNETVIENVNPETTIVDTISYSSEYIERPSYSFSINQSGWYNIDCFIANNIDLVTDVELKATVNNAIGKTLDVYLCIPSRKLLTTGYGDSSIYYFGDTSTVELIKGDVAFIYVLGLQDEKYYYGISKFVVNDKQHLVIDLKESTKEKIVEALRKNKIDNIQIDKNEPVVESFIEVDMPDSLNHLSDTAMIKKEMQIIKKNCDSEPATAMPGAVAYAKH